MSDLTWNNDQELDRLIDRMCDQIASADELAALGKRLVEDPEACEHYIACLELHARLAWQMMPGKPFSSEELLCYARASDDADRQEGSGFRIQGSEEKVGSGQWAAGSRLSLDNQQSPIHPIVLDLSPTLPPPLFTLQSPVGGFLFSYLVAVLLLGVGLLVGWTWTISRNLQVAHVKGVNGDRSHLPPSGRSPRLEVVGRITGMFDCRWTDPANGAFDAPDVPLGRKFSLASGFVEITYNSGAKVILEGPAAYDVDSASGGFLSLGRLTAWVEAKEGTGSKGERTANLALSKNETAPTTSLAPLPSPLFSVRTPSAVVTDLGTEFGVEVDRTGASKAHVFRGRVEVRPTQADEDGHDLPPGGRVIRLGPNESARVARGANRDVTVIRESGQPAPFVRQMPKRTPIKIFGTGVGLKPGDPDPHWQLVAVSNRPDLKPLPAVVRVDDFRYLTNDPAHSQWISAVADVAVFPDQVTYTFRTTFDLAGLSPNSAVLWCRFLADDRVTAIRLNGRSLEIPNYDDRAPFIHMHDVRFATGFVEGTNVLEIDVFNGGYPGATPESGSPMALRAEWAGSFVPAPAAATAAKGKPVADSPTLKTGG